MTADTLFEEWSRSMRDIRAADIIKMAVDENNMDVIKKIVDILDAENFNCYVIKCLIRGGRDFTFMIDKGFDDWHYIAECAVRYGNNKLFYSIDEMKNHLIPRNS